MLIMLTTYRQRDRAMLFKVMLMLLNVFVSLTFGLADYLVWLTNKNLDSLISRRIDDH